MSVQSRTASAAVFIAAVATTALLMSSSALAQNRPVTIYGETRNAQTELVSFARLNLSKVEDQRRLNRRVGAAVERVCLRDIGRDGLQDRDYYACHRESWNDASPQIAQAIARSTSLALAGSGPATSIAIRVRAR